MANTEYDAVFYSTDELSQGQYMELLNLIQSEHAFAGRDGANVKYVDTCISAKTVLDTRDGSIFNFSMRLRGFGYIAFAKEAEFQEIPVKKGGVEERTGLSMYDTVRKFLGDQGVLEEQPLNASHIGALRGTRAIIGEYCGTILLPEHIADFPGLTGFVGDIKKNIEDIHLFDFVTSDRRSGHIFFDNGTKDAVVFNVEKRIVFRGKLERLSDLFHVLRLTGIRSSY